MPSQSQAMATLFPSHQVFVPEHHVICYGVSLWLVGVSWGLSPPKFFPSLVTDRAVGETEEALGPCEHCTAIV